MKSKQIISKIQQKGIGWMLGRITQEANYGGKLLFSFAKPAVNVLQLLLLRPLSSYISLKRSRPAHPALYLFYDLEVSPITFDFSWALALANNRAKQLKSNGIHVVLVPGNHLKLRQESPDYDKKINYNARYWRKHELIYSLCNLVPNCTGVTLCSSREQADLLRLQAKKHIFPEKYLAHFPIAHTTYRALQSKQSLMPFQATKQGLLFIKQWLSYKLHNRKLITITLRQSAFMPARNSRLQAWAEFAKKLDPLEYFVVVVPDTETAFNPKPSELKAFVYFTEPCWNISLRAALYELSYLNLGVNNGAMTLCWLNKKCRYLTFKMIVEGVPQTSETAFHEHGLIIGESLPFSRPFQKWVWQNDDESIISKEFNAMVKQIETNVKYNTTHAPTRIT